MKKILFIMLLIFSIITLSGCENKEKDSNYNDQNDQSTNRDTDSNYNDQNDQSTNRDTDLKYLLLSDKSVEKLPNNEINSLYSSRPPVRF